MAIAPEFVQMARRSAHARMSRISRVLHDHLSQSLSAAGLELDLIQLDYPDLPEGLAAALGELRKKLEVSVEAARGLMNQLRPDLVQRIGFHPAMQSFSRAAGLASRTAVLYIADTVESPPEQIGAAMFEIAGYAVDNAVCHSGSARVEIVFRRKGPALELEIRDNGCGFNVQSEQLHPRGLGLPTMRWLAESTGLDFGLNSAPGSGTIISLLYASYGSS